MCFILLDAIYISGNLENYDRKYTVQYHRCRRRVMNVIYHY